MTGVAGQIRVRSNVISEDDVEGGRGWSLVPGDLLVKLRPNSFSKAVDRKGRQFDELMYGAPCSVCDRRISLIALEGCERPNCPSPSDDLVARVRDAHAAGLRAIEEARAEEGGSSATVRLRMPDAPSSVDVLSPEEAVGRLVPEDDPADADRNLAKRGHG